MRIAIFSDVHGNLTALEAVLDHIHQQPDVDKIIFAGDACLFGPRPEACAQRIRAVVDAAVYGNTDEWIFQPLPFTENDSNRERLAFLRQTADWTRAQLSVDSAGWLQELPFAQRISPTGRDADDLLVVHANPVDTMQVIAPPIERQHSLGYTDIQTDEALAPLLANTTAAVLAFGHLHIPSLRPYTELLLANISSVSLPGDGDHRAKYAICTWDGHQWHVNHERVEYNKQAEIDAFRQFQPPDWEKALAQLSVDTN